ncbi:class I adenylate-forming enzyme family protein [Williamsia sp. SKLECPSW1]
MRTLATQLLQRAERTPQNIAVIDQHGEHSLGSVVDAARGLADALADLSASPPTVAVQADNTWQTLACAIAVGLRGGVVAVLSPHLSPTEFDLVVEDIAPDVVVADPDVLSAWGVDDGRFPTRVDTPGPRTAVATAETRDIDRRGDGAVIAMTAPSPQRSMSRISPVATAETRDIDRWGDGAVIAMTSGSTGRAKCVVQSESAIRYAAQCTIDTVGLRAGDAVAAFVPLSSVAAACFGMYLPALLDATMVCIEKWSPTAALASLREHSVAWTMLVPTMALQMSIAEGSETPLTAMRAITVGGGPMNVAALQRAEATLGTTFLRVFGMSECLGHTTPSLTDPPPLRLGRDGRPFPGTVVRAVAADGSPLPAGEIGDAQVRGPSLFVGYAREGRPQAPDLTEDGFLPTGDLVEVGDGGFITVMGRQKQIIIRGGRNIDINEVESAIAGLPGVVQVCVVPVPDSLLGERAAALVVAQDTKMTLASVTDQLDRTGFPKSKWPEYVFTVDDLPQNRVGKLSRRDAIALASRLAGTPTH